MLHAVHIAATEADALLLHLERFPTLPADCTLDEAPNDFSRAMLHTRHLGTG